MSPPRKTKKHRVNRVALYHTRRPKRRCVIFQINFLADSMATYIWNFICRKILSRRTTSRLEHVVLVPFDSGHMSFLNFLFLLVKSVFLLSFFNRNFGIWFNILSLFQSLSNLHTIPYKVLQGCFYKNQMS